MDDTDVERLLFYRKLFEPQDTFNDAGEIELGEIVDIELDMGSNVCTFAGIYPPKHEINLDTQKTTVRINSAHAKSISDTIDALFN